MTQLDTIAIENAFADLMSELNRIKDLNDIAASYKTTASELSEQITRLVNSTQAFLVANSDSLRKDISELTKFAEALKALSEEYKSSIEPLKTTLVDSISNAAVELKGCSESQLAKISEIKSSIESLSQSFDEKAKENLRSIQNTVTEECTHCSDTIVGKISNAAVELKGCSEKQHNNVLESESKNKMLIIIFGTASVIISLASLLISII
jgi:DNA anti-recombination protein RmuC